VQWTPERADKKRRGHHLILAGILLAQAIRAALLTRDGSLSVHEATTIATGRTLLDAWWSGGPALHHSSSFTGVPELYPVFAAVVNSLGGFELVRYASLLFMLGATSLAYLVGRRLFSTSAGLLAAASFVTVAGTQQMGSLATNGALALLLVAAAAAVVVRYSTELAMLPRSGALLGAPILVLADLIRYGSLEFDPIVLGLVLFITWERYDLRLAVRQTVIFGAVVTALLVAISDFAGTAFTWDAVKGTFAGPPSNVPRGTILRVSVEWIGPLAGLALLAAGALVVWRASDRFQPRSPWTRPTGVGVVLALAVLVAPLNQLRTGRSQALIDHVAVGAWFAAIIVGFLLAQIVARKHPASRCISLVAVVVVLAGLFGAGVHQSGQLSGTVAGSRTSVRGLRPLEIPTDTAAPKQREVQRQ
jgi:hypothetical protein